MKKRMCLAAFMSLVMILSLVWKPAPAMATGSDYTSGHEEFEGFTQVEALRERVYNGLDSFQIEIDISDFRIPCNENNKEAFFQIARDYCNYAENFHVTSSGISLWYYPTHLAKLTVTYVYPQEEYIQRLEPLKTAAATLLQGIEGNEDLDDVQKALLLHDRLGVWNRYDTGNYQNGTVADISHMAYGALVNRISVCDGYAKAYMYLLDRVGVESRIVRSEKMNHAWNIVYIDDIPYHVDVTHDDAGNREGYISHDNFLVSTQGYYNSSVQHQVDDYDTSPVDTRYDNCFWQSSHTAFQLVDEEIYYIDSGNGALMCWDEEEHEYLWDVSDKWMAGPGTYWVGNYSCLAATDSKLLYSQSEAVYAYDPEDHTSKKIFMSSRLDNYNRIYGFYYVDGYLICNLAASPNDIDHGDPACTTYHTEKIYYRDTNPSIAGMVDMGDQTGWVTVRLYKDGSLYAEAVTSGEYCIEAAPGTYTLEVSAEGFLTAAYTIQVGGDRVIQNVQLQKLGDVTGDGKVTAADYARLALHVKGLRPLTDEEVLRLADITGDGKVTAADYARLARIVKGLV